MQRCRSSYDDAISKRREWRQSLQRESTMQDRERWGELRLLFAYLYYAATVGVIVVVAAAITILYTLYLLEKSRIQSQPHLQPYCRWL